MADLKTHAKRGGAAVAAVCALATCYEGTVLKSYVDPVGVLTACTGHTGPELRPGQVFTQTQCASLLNADVARAVAQVQRCVPNAPDRVLAAFGDATYNLGPAIACDRSRSTAARLLAAGQWDAACLQLPRWNTAGGRVLPGLTRRRNADLDLCLKGQS
jgi:GH24 family phage-related lysozyme (muramidase)